jgi:CRISPR/Cas system-associated exonuclease Cas4 (RecB family)
MRYYLAGQFSKGLTMAETERRETIRASGMSEYVFCARAWWLRRTGHEPTRGAGAREAGRLWHEGHGQRVERAESLRRASIVCALLAVALAVFIFLLWWRG